MKRLNLQSKKSRFDNFNCTGILTFLFLISGCVWQNSDSDDMPENWFEVHSEAGHKIATLTDSPCQKNTNPEWLLHLHSAVGTQRIFVQPNDGINVRIQDNRLHLDQPPLSKQIYTDLCQSKPNKDLSKTVQNWLQAIAPDCRLSMKKDGWHCQLPRTSRKVAKYEVQKLRKQILRSTKRPAYLLTRRVAVTQYWSTSKSIKQLCELTRFSTADELPLVMANQSWQRAVCSPKETSESKREELIEFALNKSLQEIDRLLRLIQTTNRTGSVRLKLNNNPTRDILVRLAPEDAVNQELAKSLAQQHQHKACWHPIFAETIPAARALGLAGHNENVICSATQGLPYIARSIQGETEFIITNGRYKTLVLPKGRYRFTLTAVQKNRQPEQQFQSGAFDWKLKRPLQVIKDQPSKLQF